MFYTEKTKAAANFHWLPQISALILAVKVFKHRLFAYLQGSTNLHDYVTNTHTSIKFCFLLPRKLYVRKNRKQTYTDVFTIKSSRFVDHTLSVLLESKYLKNTIHVLYKKLLICCLFSKKSQKNRAIAYKVFQC